MCDTPDDDFSDDEDDVLDPYERARRDPAVVAWDREHRLTEAVMNEVSEIIARGDVRSLAKRLSAGLDPDGSFDRMSLLSFAVGVGQLQAATLLLDAGAKIDAPGTDLLHTAAAYGNPSAIELLLARGLDVDTRNSFGETALHLASSTIAGDPLACVQLLLRRGADPAAVNIEGRTPREYAGDGGSRAVRRCLAEASKRPGPGEAEEESEDVSQRSAEALDALGALTGLASLQEAAENARAGGPDAARSRRRK